MKARVVVVPEWVAIVVHGFAVGTVAASVFSLLWGAF